MRVRQLHGVDRRDRPHHLGDSVDALFFLADVGGAAQRVHHEVHCPRVLGDDGPRAVRLRHHRHVRAVAVIDGVDGPHAAVELGSHARDHHIATKPDP